MYLNLMPLKIPDFEKPDKRTSDIRINFPIYYSETYILKPYSGYSYQLVNDTILESSYGFYSIHSQLSQNDLIVKRELVIYPGEYNVSGYKPFYQFFMSLKSFENNNPIILSKN